MRPLFVIGLVVLLVKGAMTGNHGNPCNLEVGYFRSVGYRTDPQSGNPHADQDKNCLPIDCKTVQQIVLSAPGEDSVLYEGCECADGNPPTVAPAYCTLNPSDPLCDYIPSCARYEISICCAPVIVSSVGNQQQTTTQTTPTTTITTPTTITSTPTTVTLVTNTATVSATMTSPSGGYT